MKHVRKRLTYANVMSTVAAFLALGGASAVAANQLLPANSVGPRQLQPRAVKTGYIDRNAVRVGKIGLEAVRAGKLARNAVPTNRLRDGAVATRKIADGAVLAKKLGDGSVTAEKLGAAAVTASKLGPIVTVAEDFAVPAENGLTDQTVQCPSGSVAIGGGAEISGSDTAIRQSIKFENGWRGGARNDEAAPRTLTVQAYCLAG